MKFSKNKESFVALSVILSGIYVQLQLWKNRAKILGIAWYMPTACRMSPFLTNHTLNALFLWDWLVKSVLQNNKAVEVPLSKDTTVLCWSHHRFLSSWIHPSLSFFFCWFFDSEFIFLLARGSFLILFWY